MIFSEEQYKAIKHNTGPMMVLAGPGSGKTLTIVNRVRYLITKYNVKPGSILVISFTKAAALTMQQRFNTLIAKDIEDGSIKGEVSFGTFHAIFFKILKYAYGFKSDSILREDEKYRIIKEIIYSLNIEYEDENDFLQELLSEISYVKSEMIDIDRLIKSYKDEKNKTDRHYHIKSCNINDFNEIYKRYNKRIYDLKKIDFDDMLVMCYKLFAERKDILKIWQDKYRYILVDEFQDINEIQYKVVRMLAQKNDGNDNLFIVGDDDQSIYQFRGARPEIMLGFENDYENCRKVYLNNNYRSTAAIVKLSKSIINKNKKRFIKELITNNEEGEPVEILHFPNEKDEYAYVIFKITQYLHSGYDYSDIAVLYRTNLNPRLLINKMMDCNIPFVSKDKIPNIYEHWVTLNVITYIRIAMGDYSRSNFMKIINKPTRYISREALSGEKVSFDDIRDFYDDKRWMLERIDELENDLKLLRKMNPFAGINYIRKAIGYDKYLEEYSSEHRIKVDDLFEILDDVQEHAGKYKTYTNWLGAIEEYKESIIEKNRFETTKEGINFLTMHTAKGLEFKAVFIIDVNEKIIPHNKAIEEDEIEEERRLFYVAATRAKNNLHIYSVDEKYNRKIEISRFLKDIN